MASGLGIGGYRGRCYDLWMDFRECMMHCTVPKDCLDLQEDYFECLHHHKEYRRRFEIEKERKRQEKEAKEGAGKGAHHK